MEFIDPIPYGLGAQLQLSFALYGERYEHCLASFLFSFFFPGVRVGDYAHSPYTFVLGSLKGSASRWCGYLQSLPEELVDLPVFWTLAEGNSLADRREGAKWLRGTEAERAIKRVSDGNGGVLVSQLVYPLRK